MALYYIMFGFMLGFACATEIGRQVYNKKMGEITKIADGMERSVSKKERV